MASNSDTGGNFGTPLLIIIWTLFGISFTTVALRVFTKVYYVQRRLLLDDFLMCCASACQLINNIFDTRAVHYGMGRHFNNLAPNQQVNAMKWIFLQEPFAVSSSAFGRVAFALYLLHLIGPTARVKKAILQAIILIQAIVDVVVVVQLLTQCGAHIDALWLPAVKATAHCQSPLVETYIGYVQSAINSLCDACLTIIPLMVIKKLNMDTRTKVGLVGLLCLSVFAFSASIVKAVEIGNLAARNNFTWNMAFLTLCICIENNLVMIGASIPTLRPFLRSFTGDKYSSNGPYNRSTARSKYAMGTTTNNHHNTGGGSMRKSAMETTARGPSPLGRDGSSEEIMLENGAWPAGTRPGSANGLAAEKGEITRTTDLTITYGAYTRSSSTTARGGRQPSDEG